MLVVVVVHRWVMPLGGHTYLLGIDWSSLIGRTTSGPAAVLGGIYGRGYGIRVIWRIGGGVQYLVFSNFVLL